MSKLLVICLIVIAVAAAASADCEQAAKQWVDNHNEEHPGDKIAKLVDILSCSPNGFPKYTVMSVRIEKASGWKGRCMDIRFSTGLLGNKMNFLMDGHCVGA